MMIHWRRHDKQIRAAVRAARSGLRLVAKRVGLFDEAEVKTAGEVRALRARGRKVTARVIRALMRRHVAAMYDAGKAATFKATNPWLCGFVARFALSWRRATNRKSKSVISRLPAVKLYLARLARRLARHARPAIVGPPCTPPSRVPLPPGSYATGIAPWCRVNVDQVPFEFESDVRYTYDDKGAKAVHVAGAHGQHKESRFGTLQLMVNLSGVAELQPQLVIVFRGQGLKVKQQELDAYDKRVKVYFQRKAWMDDALCLRWLNEVFAPYEQRLRELLGSDCDDYLMLMVDGLSGQTAPAFVKTARTYNTLVHVGPAGTTDLTQVIDRGIGRLLKERFRRRLDDWLLDEKNFDVFTKAPKDGGLTASQKRVLVTRFAADAWDEVKASSETIVKCAQQCGALIGLGGAGIEAFRLPRSEDTLAVDFNDVGDNFANRSDVEDNTDIVDAAANDDDDDGDPSDDGQHDDDDADGNDDGGDESDDEISVDSDVDGARDDAEADDDNDNALIAPLGYALIAKPATTALDLSSATFVGKELMLRASERAAPRRATIVRQATRKDKATESNMNYTVKFDDDGSVAPVWLRNREYGLDWAFIERAAPTDSPLATHPVPTDVALEPAVNVPRDVDASKPTATLHTTHITNYFNIANNGTINAGSAAATTSMTICTASCACVAASTSSSTAACRCGSQCSTECACRAAGLCKHDGARAAKRARTE